MSDIMIEIPRRWFPDGEKLRPLHKNDQVFLYYAGDPAMIPDERYIILSVYEADTLRTKNISLQHELEKAMLEKADLETKLHAMAAKAGPVAEVSRAGVCEVCGDGAELIKVNDHNLVSELEKAIEQLNPDCDHRGAFAARVTISVELLGDMEEGSE